MDLDAVDDRGRLRPLTPRQRDYLREHNGCFACRQLGHRAGAPTCPRANSRKAPTTPPANENNAVEKDESDETMEPVESDANRYRSPNVANSQTINNINVTVPVSAIKTHKVTEVRDSDDWQLNPTIAKDLFEKWGYPKIDLFASIRNKQTHFYFRKESEL